MQGLQEVVLPSDPLDPPFPESPVGPVYPTALIPDNPAGPVVPYPWHTLITTGSGSPVM